MLFPVGTRVDVLDVNHEVFSPAIILRNHVTSIDVSYIGWDKEWDETINDIERVTMNVSKYVKAWVKLNQGICLWPCILCIRKPLRNSKMGEEYLRTESRVLTFPYGPYQSCPFKSIVKQNGTWADAVNVVPYGNSMDKTRIKNGNMSKFRNYFALAVEALQGDTESSVYQFKLEGSFDVSPNKSTSTIPPNKSKSLTGTVCHGVKLSIDNPINQSSSTKQILQPTFVLNFDEKVAVENLIESNDLLLSHNNYVDVCKRAKSANSPIKSRKQISNTIPQLSEPKFPSVAGINAVVKCLGQDLNSLMYKSKPRRASQDEKMKLNTISSIKLFDKVEIFEQYAESNRKWLELNSNSKQQFDFAEATKQLASIHTWNVKSYGMSKSKLQRDMRWVDHINFDDDVRLRKRKLPNQII